MSQKYVVFPAYWVIAFTTTFSTVSLAQKPISDDALVTELNALAKQIKSTIDKKGGGAVAVGVFSGTTRLQSNSGPEIQRQLAAALSRQKVTVDSDKYRFEVTGNYRDLKHPERQILGVQIGCRVQDTDFNTLAEFKRFVFGRETVPKLLGVSAKVKPTADPDSFSEKLEDALKNPPSKVTKTVISNGGAYAVEILVKSGTKYVPRVAEKNSRGRVFVPIRRDEVYSVKLINNSPHEAAVHLAIDGIGHFEFSEIKPKPRFWLVPPQSSSIVRGWYVSDKNSLEFKVTDYPSSAAAKVNLKATSSTIGVITASFSASWDKEENKPLDEGTTRATGFGKKIDDPTKKVSRFIGQPRESIVVRYEK